MYYVTTSIYTENNTTSIKSHITQTINEQGFQQDLILVLSVKLECEICKILNKATRRRSSPSALELRNESNQ